MTNRRQFLKGSLLLTASGLFLGTRSQSVFAQQNDDKTSKLKPPPDLFDAQALDMDFWLRPRTLDLVRPTSGERLKVLYWKDGEVIDSAYQQCCEILRDVNAKKTAPIDPKLLETLWATQAFIAQFGMTKPLEILSGYRTQNRINDYGRKAFLRHVNHCTWSAKRRISASPICTKKYWES